MPSDSIQSHRGTAGISEREIKMDEFDTIKKFLAEEFAVPCKGYKNYFDEENEELSDRLRDLQEFVAYMVTLHDSLADEVAPNRRLVGKRGRKAGAEKIITAEDVMKSFNRKKK
jgi:hypothetical protein